MEERTTADQVAERTDISRDVLQRALHSLQASERDLSPRLICTADSDYFSKGPISLSSNAKLRTVTLQ
ncbi:hypothetical protein QQF64_004811 [Cirrhinus molitorella]|uniref:Uncharacterized protein n=1 Tax=Cirrhinus molitorella TaxID=172907 RepID=A0ABR3MHA9_9TELE